MIFLTRHEIKYLAEKYPDRRFFTRVFAIQDNCRRVTLSFSRDEEFSPEAIGKYCVVALLSDKELIEEIKDIKAEPWVDYALSVLRRERVKDLTEALGQEHLLELEKKNE